MIERGTDPWNERRGRDLPRIRRRRGGRAAAAATSRRSLDRGFTLAETVIVTTLMGLVMGTLGLVVSAVLRTTPITEGHVDDARSLRDIATWLADDAMSSVALDITPAGSWTAPPSPLGVDTHPDNPGLCGAFPGTTNLVQFAWRQVDSATRVFVSNYRFDPTGERPVVMRVTCTGGSFATLSESSRQRLTTGLAPAQNFATASQYDGATRTLTLRLVSDSGTESLVRVASRNPST